MDGQNSKDDCNFPPISRKRRHFDDDDCKDRDEDCGASAPKILIEEPPFCLLDFCDEILLEILKNLDSYSFHSIEHTCLRLHRLIADYRLWKTRKLDLTSEELPQETIRKRLKPMHQHTDRIAIKGLTGTFPKDSWNNVTMDKTLLRDITETCENLQVLELHHSFLNLENMAITDFPRNLKRLVFNNCFIRGRKAPPAFFTQIDTHLGNLEELILEYCNWFDSCYIHYFSPIYSLKKLSLRGCANLQKPTLRTSICTSRGFTSLEYLDVRDTAITDSNIRCFNVTYTLKELLLECPDDIRKMHSSNSSYPWDPWYLRDLRHPRDPRNHVNLEADPEKNGDGGGGVALRRRLDIHRAISQSLWFERRYPPPFSPPRIYSISDRGILGFSAPRDIAKATRKYLERLTVRHYKRVTDTSLTHLAQCSPKLVFLDLTGTAVTKAGVEEFKAKKPNCFVVSDHFTG